MHLCKETVFEFLRGQWYGEDFWCEVEQHVNEPTRGNNILDLVMTTTDLSINGLEVTGKIGDHQMIDFSLDVQDPNTRTQHKQVLDYKRANFELMKEELGIYNYEVLMSNKNAEECYMIFKDKIATATGHHIPRKRIRPTNNLLGFHKKLNASSMQDNIPTEDSNDTKQNSIVKNISTPAWAVKIKTDSAGGEYRGYWRRVQRLLEESTEATGGEYRGYWRRVQRLLEESTEATGGEYRGYWRRVQRLLEESTEATRGEYRGY
ncbi:hypothetical protein FHG87_017943 [Trinorchestia longiramus]|nr:hypothetical protein FHG87_017943 [Trinorchestia longiramus]